tara:strand:+ start:3373 stop:4116 length:744 start_codon:yes stop_codon:yes gene_type:complete
MYIALITTSILAIAGLVWLVTRFECVVVSEYQHGLVVTKGRVVGPAKVGFNWIFEPTTKVWVFDARPSATSMQLQEVLTADGITVKASLSMVQRIADAKRFVTVSTNVLDQVYIEAQLALRDVIAGIEFDALMSDRSAVAEAMLPRVRAEAERLGLELESLALKDLVVGSDLKRALNDIVLARAESRAELERTRGKTAAVRSMVNAAKLVEQHPGFAQLQWIEAAKSAAESDGNTLVLGVPQGVVTP